MLLSSKRTDLAEMFIPGPFDQLHILFNDPQQLSQSTRIKTIALSERNDGADPIFCFATRTDNMYMHRLARTAFV